MNQDQDGTKESQAKLSKLPSKTKLVLPHGECSDIEIDDLQGADVVEANDGVRFVVLFVRPNRTVMVTGSPENIATLKACTAVREAGNF